MTLAALLCTAGAYASVWPLISAGQVSAELAGLALLASFHLRRILHR